MSPGDSGPGTGKLVRMQTPRLLFVHAHPDDEAINNGATIAHYAARGAQVNVVTCTLGEEGEVIGSRWAQLTVDAADQLGGYRIGELTEALRALGIGGPIFLGGAGRWRDSGMAGAPPHSRRRFTDADPQEAVAAMVDILDELRPHVVVSYDPKGGYGHPDHIQAHRVTAAAVAASQDGGPGWTVPKFYWTVVATSAFAATIDALSDFSLPAGWAWPDPAELSIGYPDSEINAVIDAPDSWSAKVAALVAHATQVRVAPGGRVCALSNNMALPILASEHYILACGSAGERDARGWETDLLAGVDLS
jgi:N-acetyl-1-D-myo-inositol-2-amino-2-deoxy-alpha-D-glucopyranoside deacetylase